MIGTANIPSDWKATTFDKIFSAEQWKSVMEFVNKKDVNGLRLFLAGIKEELLKKEVLDGFVFYVICDKFKLDC